MRALAVAAVLALAGSAAAGPPDSRTERRSAEIVVVGHEGTIGCFNPYVETCAGNGGDFDIVRPVLRGAFAQTPSWSFAPDLVAEAHATKTTLSYRIRDNAYWYWGGRKLPITYKDFVYTWRMIIDPKNAIAWSNRPTYVGMTSFRHDGSKRITFRWKAALGNWQTLFPVVLPSAAVSGLPFGTLWKDCLCGRDGKPVADGPFMLARHTGAATTLTPNPFWYGRRPSLRQLVFVPLRTPAEEVAAVRSGSIDVVSPSSSLIPAFPFEPWLQKLLQVPGMSYEPVPSIFAEHIDMQFGPKGTPLLSARWFRRAIAMGIDRKAVIRASLGRLGAGIGPLDSLMYSPGDSRYRPDFARWSYDPEAALALLKRHCSGGPTSPGPTTAVWTCSGVAASVRFMYDKTNPFRVRSFRLIRTELGRIGIAVGNNGVSRETFFGTNGIQSSDYDLAEFAWGNFDPNGSAEIWSCNMPANYLNYCNHATTAAMQAGASALDTTTAHRQFARADAQLAADLPSLPLYNRPWPLLRAARLEGIRNVGWQIFTWNVEDWRWR